MQMKDLSVQQYLTRIKTIVDGISTSGSKIESEDVMLHILNGLPPLYNSFKSTIRNSLLPIDLDTFYALLCNEELHLQQENLQEQTNTTGNTHALYAASVNSTRSRNGSTRRFNKPKPQPQAQTTTAYPPNQQPASRPLCQICGKIGHIALNCWHRNNPKYAPTDTRPPRALFANPSATVSHDWIIDSGASTHLTPDVNQLHYSTPYQGNDTVSTANGNSIPINNAGQGILPLPDPSRSPGPSSAASWTPSERSVPY
ncbi:Retrovirus-related Pol polyprotein from transposon TNT 1-94 [Dendrobium catenatum]|uniref:Retrovirus-related Pol polyprotein from transposon TNT 1-94 n=1 Tax=Dendrobium catenatum TaxID=906689 RepID=A0A2I0WGQ6_9ASPA|nr:Retrovirus-related Pol polyprotein from transposon TNT 1-94 [Dendrobium catenatum]